MYPLRYEAASDLSYASNLFVDELSARGVLMGMRINTTHTTRCPLRSAVRDEEAATPCTQAAAPCTQAATPCTQPRAPSPVHTGCNPT